jgi:hypothetical protein
MHTVDLRRCIERKDLPIGSLASVEAAALPGYRLTFDYFSRARQGGAANVTESGTRAATSYAESGVFGAVLHVDQVLLDALDEKEGHPHRYCRVQRSVLLRSGEAITAWVYVVTPACRAPSAVPPTRRYLELLVEGAAAHALPEHYVRALRGVLSAGGRGD